VTINITGDAALAAAYQQYSNDLGMAINATVKLAAPIKAVAEQTVSVFQGFGDIGVGGASCIASQATLISSLQANVSVSVSVSASVSGSAG
jgi:hypothetical protein